MHKANFFQWLWICVASAGVTFKYCLLALWTATRYPAPRTRIDAVCRRWSLGLLRLIDLRWIVVGAMPALLPERRYIVMCSHASHYDIPLSFVAIPGSLRMMAKKELSRIPLFGAAMQRSEFVFIDRHNRDRSLKDLVLAKKKMESGIVLWVSPEGTRSKDGRLLPFKKGCFHLAIDTQAIVIPVVIRHIIKVLPKGETRPHLGVEVEFVYGEPIDAGEYPLERRQDLSDRVEGAMRVLLAPQGER